MQVSWSYALKRTPKDCSLMFQSGKESDSDTTSFSLTWGPSKSSVRRLLNRTARSTVKALGLTKALSISYKIPPPEICCFFFFFFQLSHVCGLGLLPSELDTLFFFRACCITRSVFRHTRMLVLATDLVTIHLSVQTRIEQTSLSVCMHT